MHRKPSESETYSIMEKRANILRQKKIRLNTNARMEAEIDPEVDLGPLERYLFELVFMWFGSGCFVHKPLSPETFEFVNLMTTLSLIEARNL